MKTNTPLTDIHWGDWQIQVRIVSPTVETDLPTFKVYAFGIREALLKAMGVLQISVPGPLPDPRAEYGSIEAMNADRWDATYHITATY